MLIKGLLMCTPILPKYGRIVVKFKDFNAKVHSYFLKWYYSIILKGQVSQTSYTVACECLQGFKECSLVFSAITMEKDCKNHREILYSSNGKIITTLLYEMPSNPKGKNFVWKIYWNFLLNLRVLPACWWKLPAEGNALIFWF